MIPAKHQKLDLSKLSEEELATFKKYGRLPQGMNKAPLLNRAKERKYFDSGDYALSKAGKNPAPVGEEHPAADNIPHLQPTTNQIPVVPGLSPPKHHGLENEVIDEEPANGQPPLSPKDTVAPQGLGAHLQHLGGLAGTQQPPAHPPAPGFMRRPSNLQNNAQFRVVQKD